MKKSILFLLLLGLFLPMLATAQEINLTPVPKQITMRTGKLVLPQSFTIETGSLSEEHCYEARKFAKHITAVTGFAVEVKSESSDALIKMSLNESNDELGAEGYTLNISSDKIEISANEASGFYFAFQTIKKLLPACVMAGVKDSCVTEYSLPQLSIVDAPRFEYRGFMLDVARHYFEVDEIKRMIDVMSYYKMNRFHWHIVDDQGWRIQIDKYPKLTSVGSKRSNSWSVDPTYGGYYINEPYGPYFYTKEEAKDIVAYAKERHIEIIPEIEFPGHACAALAAYPEFSCSPNGSHSVKVDGGVYADVFNVGNPATLQFAKDVLDEIIEIFPYNQIHIGGDECPTSAWSGNEQCLALMQKEGFSDIRELQSHFVRQLADYLRQKQGDKSRNVIMWNESLSAGGTNVNLIKGTEGTLMCWESGKVQSSALQAAQLGMNAIITPIGPYYINRKQSTDPGEPTGAGSGTDDVRSTYNYVPVPDNVPVGLRQNYIGIQGTFWTEHVQSNYLLEYLALPRLIAIAETGWTPANKKNFDDFCRRITADTLLLNYNNYEYGRHFINKGGSNSDKVMPQSSTDSEKHWYRIVTGATDNRAGKCIELLREGAPQIGTGNAQANRLWNGTVAAESDAAYDYQQWAFMEDPNNAGKYALVCKAKPNGSVNSTPTASNNTARWDYDDSKRHYDFILGEAVYTKNGDYYRYSIRSQKAAAGMYMNFAGPGQNNSINMWSDPNDGNGGVWELQPMENKSEPIAIDYPKQGTTVRIANNVERFANWRLIDNGRNYVTAEAAEYAADVWEIVSATEGADGQSVTLRNLATGRYISSNSYPLALGTSAAILKNVYNTRTNDFSIKAGDNGAIYPMPEKAVANAHTLNVGGIYPQGSAWVYEPVYQITYDCYDNQGKAIGEYHCSAPQGAPYSCAAPTLKNMKIVGYGNDGSSQAPAYDSLDSHKKVKVVYEKSAYNITLRYIEKGGGIIKIDELSCPIGESITLPADNPEYYQAIDVEGGNETLTPTSDVTLTNTYSLDGFCGFRAIGEPVKKVETGKSYLLFNNKNENARNGYLYANNNGANIMTDNGAASGSPAYIWTIEKSSGDYVKVHNEYGLYIPELTKGAANKASTIGGNYTFTAADDGTQSVKSSNGLYWNGNDDHTFTGWTDAHPFIAFEYYVEPYFEVTTEYIDEDNNELHSTDVRYIKAGEMHTVIPQPIENYAVKEIQGATSEAQRVVSNMNIVITYASNPTAIQEITTEKNSDDAIYNLQGVRINKPQRGIYIQRGKKIFVK
ncbi:MAG: family 20 glycosylhydrolase [Bacteroidaceae bacterium]|nr:family 20 glycosylhydrolase [Bacteroidaceae bacterium]